MAFFRHFRVKNGPFLGGKWRVGSNTPKKVYYYHWGDFIERYGRKMCEKTVKNGNVKFFTYLFFGLLGVIWLPDCSPLTF